MSTPTPTRNNGPLDETLLAQMASELFRLLPNSAIDQPAASDANPATAKLTPASAAPTGLPDAAAQSLPAIGGRFGGVVLGVPEAYAAALPQVNAAPSIPSSVPYYFLDETSLPASATPAHQPSAHPTFGIHDADALNAHLAQLSIEFGYSRRVESGSYAARPERERHFYFLDPITADTPKGSPSGYPRFDVHAVRRDFPILHQKVHGKQLIWLDSAATSQKPQSVIDAEASFYEHDNSNIHRAAHALAARATDAYEGARQKIQHFLGAASPEEIIFVRGATEGINLLAQTCGRQRLQAGDEIILTTLEHHANIVPWQFIAKEKGATLKVVPINDDGEVLLDAYARLLSPRTRIVALAHVSNTLGTVLPVELMAAMARQYGATVIIDGAQSVPHLRVNVQALDCDFFVFSGHKLFAPTGIGVVYGKKALLEELPPWQGGGNMIDQVTFEQTTFNQVPYKFEAGTGHIGGAVGLGAAIDYLNQIGFDAALRYEDDLLAYATQALSSVPDLRFFGNAAHKVGTLSFALGDIPPEEIGKFLDREGIAVRAGHHCAQPTMQRFGVKGMVRPSLAFYNTHEEIDALTVALFKAKKALS